MSQQSDFVQEFGHSAVTDTAQERKLQQQRDVQAALQQQIEDKKRLAVCAVCSAVVCTCMILRLQ